MSIYNLKVKEISRESSAAVSIEFDVPTGLQEIFSFEAGQHLTLQKEFDGELLRRTYSICTRPWSNQWKIAVKEIPGGKFSGFINNELVVGDNLEVMPPSGNFKVVVDKRNIHKYVGFAAGSGITPIISQIKCILFEEPKSHFILFYSNRSLDQIIFREELEDLKNLYMERFIIFHVLSRETHLSPLFTGRIDADKCRSYCKLIFDPLEVDQYVLCGPFDMVECIREVLKSEGVNAQNISSELFVAPDVLNSIQVAVDETDTNKEGKIDLEVNLDGENHHLEITDAHISILDQARSGGLDLPFACKAGVCGTCKSKLIMGKVKMYAKYALEEEEVNNGFILTCQSKPTTKSLTIDFDIKS